MEHSCRFDVTIREYVQLFRNIQLISAVEIIFEIDDPHSILRVRLLPPILWSKSSLSEQVFLDLTDIYAANGFIVVVVACLSNGLSMRVETRVRVGRRVRVGEFRCLSEGSIMQHFGWSEILWQAKLTANKCPKNGAKRTRCVWLMPPSLATNRFTRVMLSGEVSQARTHQPVLLNALIASHWGFHARCSWAWPTGDVIQPSIGDACCV